MKRLWWRRRNSGDGDMSKFTIVKRSADKSFRGLSQQSSFSRPKSKWVLQPFVNFNKIAINQYKTYYSWRCKIVGESCHKIVLVKKSSWFCSTCKQDLEENGLVEDCCKNEGGANSFGAI